MNAGTFPAPSVSSALTVQGRVITALILREVHTLYGKYTAWIPLGNYTNGVQYRGILAVS